MQIVYLSLGSNLGNREANLKQAIRMLECPRFRVLRVSSIFETEPMDIKDQPWFLNLALEAESELFPMQLLSRIGRIEKQMGRTRTIPKGPRTLDIDILLFGPFIVDTPHLAIPHPRMTDRRFVMEPLAELAPELRHPVLRRTMQELIPESAGKVLRRNSV
jgi:2-amino-4-hydroxy-6-hydroxymethyldihydropteridine diphosphokinase